MMTPVNGTEFATDTAPRGVAVVSNRVDNPSNHSNTEAAGMDTNWKRGTHDRGMPSTLCSGPRSDQEQDQALAAALLPLASDVTIGVDRIRLAFPLDPQRTDGSSMHAYWTRRGAIVRDVVLWGKDIAPHLRISSRSGQFDLVGMWATVEFNPARVASAAAAIPGVLCPWNDVRAVVEGVLRHPALENAAPVLGDVGDARVLGLHLTRDFVVRDSSDWVLATAKGRAPAWSRRQALYFDEAGVPETMEAGTKHAKLIVYAKDTESKTPTLWSAQHPLRWEYQLTGATTLGRLGIQTVDSLVPEGLAHATARLWRRSRTGEVRKTPDLAETLGAAGLEPGEARDLLGWLAARSASVDLEGDLGRVGRRAYTERASAVGVRVTKRAVTVLADPWRLDIVGGRELPADAESCG